jgi:hypothetical protein
VLKKVLKLFWIMLKGCWGAEVQGSEAEVQRDQVCQGGDG